MYGYGTAGAALPEGYIDVLIPSTEAKAGLSKVGDGEKVEGAQGGQGAEVCGQRGQAVAVGEVQVLQLRELAHGGWQLTSVPVPVPVPVSASTRSVDTVVLYRTARQRSTVW